MRGKKILKETLEAETKEQRRVERVDKEQKQRVETREVR